MAENIFCLARTNLEQAGMLNSGQIDLAALLALPHYFIPRPEAEKNDAFKQIIPYQVFVCGGRVFVFRRGGGVGEQRLSGRLSIGIGGHVNDGDSENGVMTKDTFAAALMREREEELVVSGPVETVFLGLINDDSDAVGRVHLGAVFSCRVADPDHVRLREKGEDLHFAGWLPPAEIMGQRDRFEKWSILALKITGL